MSILQDIKKNINDDRKRNYNETYQLFRDLNRAVSFGLITESERRRRIREMSKNWAWLENHIEGSREIRWEHLIKLYHYKDFPIYFNNWISSCIKGIDKIPTLSGSHKLPSYEKLYESSWVDLEEVFDSFYEKTIKKINSKYTEVPPIKNKDSDGVKKFVKNFTKRTSKLLAEKGGVTLEDAYDIIYDLLGLEI